MSIDDYAAPDYAPDERGSPGHPAYRPLSGELRRPDGSCVMCFEVDWDAVYRKTVEFLKEQERQTELIRRSSARTASKHSQYM